MHFASMRSKRDDMRRVICAYFIQTNGIILSYDMNFSKQINLPISRNISNCMMISTMTSFVLIPYSSNIPRLTSAHIKK